MRRPPQPLAPAASLVVAALLLVVLACDGGSRPNGAAPAAPAATASPVGAASGGPGADDGTATPLPPATAGPGPGLRAASPALPAAPRGPPPVVVFLGDSLTAGLGLAAEQAFPSLVAQELAGRGVPIRLVNAGVSGDTSAGGLRRVDWLLRQKPDVVVVALGANDALRGQPVAGIEKNLRQIVERAQAAGAEVLLVGIQVPPSYGNDYARGFAAIYPHLAAELDVALLPFLLEGVAGRPELNLADGIHPNEEGHRRMARLVATHLEPLVREDAAAPAAAAR